MESACLVTGKSSNLLAEIVPQCVDHSYRTLVARSGQLDLPGIPTEGATTVTWNRRSALSARSVLLHAQNHYGALDYAVIAYVPAADTVPFHESSIVSMEDRVDAEIKGYHFLIRELVAYFQKRGRGRLVLALQEPETDIRPPLTAAAMGSFVAFGESLQRCYENAGFSVSLCRSSDPDLAAYARFIVEGIEAEAPRKRRTPWNQFPPRVGILRRG